MKRTIFLFTFLLIFLSPIIFFNWWKQVSSPVDIQDSEPQIIVIPRGLGVEEIGKILKDRGLIKNVFAFKLIVAKEGLSKSLQAGDFRLSPSMNLFEVAQNLTHGTLDVWVTILEGLRREEVAIIIAKAFRNQEVEFDLNDFLKNTVDLEGYLFPDTYLIPKNSNVQDIIQILTNNFDKKFNLLTINTSLTKKQTVILASLIEREAKHDEDRKIVAGILLKRLKQGWPLQVDATIQYARATVSCGASNYDCKWWAPISSNDSKIDSFYNTYTNQDLPPKAICNPSLSSLKAAVDPQDSEYWFYLSDNHGNMYYSITLNEHNYNIEKYLN